MRIAFQRGFVCGRRNTVFFSIFLLWRRLRSLIIEMNLSHRVSFVFGRWIPDVSAELVFGDGLGEADASDRAD